MSKRIKIASILQVSPKFISLWFLLGAMPLTSCVKKTQSIQNSDQEYAGLSYQTLAAKKKALERINRLNEVVDKLKERYITPEFQDALKQLRKHYTKIYMDPKAVNQKPIFLILNSLPGVGKTKFIKDFVTEMKIEGRFSSYQLNEKTRYLSMSAVEAYSVSYDDLKDISGEERVIEPAVVLFDEYTHANAFEEVYPNEPNNSGETYLEKELKKSQVTMASAVQEITEKSSPDKAAQIEALNGLAKNINLQLIAIKEQKAIDASKGDALKSEIEIANRHSGILWQILANGTLSAASSFDLSVVRESLQASAESINKKYSDLALLNHKIKKTTQNMLKISKKADKGSVSKQKPNASESTEAAAPTLRSVTEFATLAQAEIKNFQTERDAMQLSVNMLQNELATELDSAQNKMKSLFEAYPQANQMLFSQDPAGKELFDKAADDYISNSLDEKKSSQNNEIWGSVLRRVYNFSAGEKFKMVFKSAPDQFLKNLEKFFERNAVSPERFAGHMMIVLAGNVVPVQNKVISTLFSEGFTCSDLKGLEADPDIQAIDIPYRDPACVRAVTQMVVNSEDGKKWKKEALRAVFGRKFDDANSVALINRLGGDAGDIPFILPPKGSDYLKLVKKEIAWAQNMFQNALLWSGETSIPETEVDKSLVDLAYIENVNAYLSYRGIEGKIESYLHDIFAVDLVRKYQIKNSEALQYRKDNADSPNALQEADSKFPLPKKIQLRFDSNTQEIIADSDLSREPFLRQPLRLKVLRSLDQPPSRSLDNSFNNHFAAFHAAEIGLNSLLRGSTPMGDQFAEINESGSFLRALNPLDGWVRPNDLMFSEWAKTILWSLSGPAGEVALAAGATLLPESSARLEFARTEILSLFRALRDEGEYRKGNGITGAGAPFSESVLGLGRPKIDISNHPILRELIQYENQNSLSKDDLEKVYFAASSYCLDFILSNPIYFKDLLALFVPLYDPNSPVQKVSMLEIDRIVQKYAKKRFKLNLQNVEHGIYNSEQGEAFTARELQKLDPETLETKWKFLQDRLGATTRFLGNEFILSYLRFKNSLLPPTAPPEKL